LHTSQTQINSLTVPNYQFEDVLIGPIVEPEDKLVDVGLKVLGGYAMVDTDYCSLEQAPECAGVRPSILGFHCLMNAVGDDADGGTVQPHEAGPLFKIAFESSDGQVLFCAFRFKSPSESVAKRYQ